jgi:haloacetate dehalogenase
VVEKCFDVLALWRERALQVTGASLPCGHYIAEEAPQALLRDATEFLKQE